MLLTTLAAGCLGETTCREVGCPDSERCNLETGECEALDRACEPGSCPEGEICDPATGDCQPELPVCGGGQTCPEGLECNVETQRCEATPGCTPGSCAAPAETCNPATDQCEPLACESDPECPDGYVCQNGECHSGCRGDSDRCPPNRFCSSDSPDEIGQCLPECRSNQSCPHGQICTTEDGLRTCRPEGPCDSDAECRDDEVCINRRCVAPPCQSDEDCASEQSCDFATGLCVGGNCEEDAFSPNHDPSSAESLQINTYTGLTVCPARDDWFAFEADSSQALSFQLQYSGDTDLDLFVYDESGELIGQNRRPAPGQIETTDRVNLISTRTQRLTIRVSAHRYDAPPRQVSYSLGIRPDDERFCRDDAEEENDKPDEATQLSGQVDVPTELSFQICGRDRDFFRLLSLPSDHGLEVGLTQASPHLRLQVLPEAHTSSTILPDESLEWLRIGEATTWLFRVASLYDRSSGYTLHYRVAERWDCPDAQAFNSAATARPVGRGTTSTSTFCPIDNGWEVEWLSLESPQTANSLLQATLTANDAMPELTVALFRRPAGGVPTLVRHATRTERGLAVAAPFGPTDTPLIRISSSATPGSISTEPTYDITYDYDAP